LSPWKPCFPPLFLESPQGICHLISSYAPFFGHYVIPHGISFFTPAIQFVFSNFPRWGSPLIFIFLDLHPGPLQINFFPLFCRPVGRLACQTVVSFLLGPSTQVGPGDGFGLDLNSLFLMSRPRHQRLPFSDPD